MDKVILLICIIISVVFIFIRNNLSVVLEMLFIHLFTHS